MDFNPEQVAMADRLNSGQCPNCQRIYPELTITALEERSGCMYEKYQGRCSCCGVQITAYKAFVGAFVDQMHRSPADAREAAYKGGQ